MKLLKLSSCGNAEIQSKYIEGVKWKAKTYTYVCACLMFVHARFDGILIFN